MVDLFSGYGPCNRVTDPVAGSVTPYFAHYVVTPLKYEFTGFHTTRNNINFAQIGRKQHYFDSNLSLR